MSELRTVKDGDFVITADGKNGIVWDIGDENCVGVILRGDETEHLYVYDADDVFFAGDGGISAGDRIVIDEDTLQCGDVEMTSDAITGTVIGVYYKYVVVVMDDFEGVEEGVTHKFWKKDVTRLV